MLEQFKRDKNGFLILENIEGDPLYKCIKFIAEDGQTYYFKSMTPDKILDEDVSLAGHELGPLSEIVSYRIINRLGVKSVEYDLARIDTSRIGVVSKDFRHIKESTQELSKLLRANGYGREGMNLATFKKLLDDGVISPNLKRELDLTSLIQVGIGQTDCHWNNVSYFDENGEDGVILFDNANTISALFPDKDEDLRGLICTYKIFGIEHKNQSWKDYTTSLHLSNNISTNSIKEYLDNLHTLLYEDKGFREINEEITEMYGKAPNVAFMDSMKFGLEYTGEIIKEAYDYRVNHIGE